MFVYFRDHVILLCLHPPYITIMILSVRIMIMPPSMSQPSAGVVLILVSKKVHSVRLYSLQSGLRLVVWASNIMNRRRSYLPIDICGIPHLHYHLYHVCIVIGLHVCITSASSLHQVCIIIRPPRPSPCPSPCPSPRPSSIEGPTDTEESLLQLMA